jgi:hypothetical protein
MPWFDVNLTARVLLSYCVEAECAEDAKTKVEAMYDHEGDCESETMEFDIAEVTGVVERPWRN